MLTGGNLALTAVSHGAESSAAVLKMLVAGRKRHNFRRIFLRKLEAYRKLIEGNAKSLPLNRKLQKDFFAAIYLFDVPAPARFLSWGGRAIL
jgi:hypothetical protein